MQIGGVNVGEEHESGGIDEDMALPADGPLRGVVATRRAADAGEKQSAFFTRIIERDNVIALVAERLGDVAGFVIAVLVVAPPVYDPGGLTCMVDDFALASEEDWTTMGSALLSEVSRGAQAGGAGQTVVVCGHQDEPKRAMLFASRYSIASEWYVSEIE